jgi:hypothetical protein
MDIKDVENINKLENEYDLQNASMLERKLRLLVNENPDLKPVRNKLRDLIKDYEDKEWSDFDHISDSKFIESL